MIALVLTCAPAPALAGCTITQMLELKVTMEGARPMVDASINGTPEKFVADSGAFFSTITPGTAAELGLRQTMLPPSFQIKGVGGSASAMLTTVKTLGLGGQILPRIDFIVGGSEVHGAGLLGQNVLGLADVEYDLADGAIRLMRARDCKNATPAYWAAGKSVSTLTIDSRDALHPHTIGTVEVNGVRLRATFDTGATQSVISLAAAARAGIKIDAADVRRIGDSSGLGRHTVPTWIVPIASIKLGDGEEIHRTHIEAADIGIDTDMLIGADFFLSHRVYVANSQHKLYFTYDGGPIFNVMPRRVMDATGAPAGAAASSTGDTPTDAEGFSRRGAAYLARHETAKAIADFDQACTLAPTQSRYFVQRATAHRDAHQPLLAMDDLDRALTLAPGDVEARLFRARLRMAHHDRAAAQEDLAAAENGLAPAADNRLAIAAFYDAMQQQQKAIGEYDLWLRYHPEDSRRADALNGRCWARAQLGSDLGKALADCDGALHARPAEPAYLDSRGLVHLRMGDNAKAIRDYDAALALAPKMAWSLYGRGLARQRSGLKAEAQQDLSAAIALNAELPARAKQLGVEP